MKVGLINHIALPNGDQPVDHRLAVSLDDLAAAQYNQRSWRRRLPAVLFASLLVAVLLLAAGISLEAAPWLVLLPLICLPLAAAVALNGS